MIKEPKVGMYILKRHIRSGRYIFGKIIMTDGNNSDELLIIDILKCKDYGYIQKTRGKYEGCACVYNYITSGYEIIYGNSYAEIVAKMI